MMLQELLGSRIRAKALGWLFTHPDQRYFVRQLCVLLNEDSTNLSRELSKLQGLGILTSTVEGRQKYFKADPDSPVFNEIKGLAVKELGILEHIKKVLEPVSNKIKTAFIFGSFADNRFDSESDIDLAIIGDIAPREAGTMLAKAGKSLLKEINPVVYSPGEFEKKASSGHHFVKSLVETKKVFIIGGENEFRAIIKGKPAQTA
jgi:predicted nucleotidyltransferase